MTKTMNINGIEFEVIKTRKLNPQVHATFNRLFSEQRKSLYDCYEKPSQAKEEIYMDWLDWAVTSKCVDCFTVDSYNTFGFTLAALLFDDDGNDVGVIRITKEHNRLYLL